MNNRFVGFKNLTQGILFVMLIIVVILFIAWLILSGVGNCANQGEVKAPDIEKARYRFYIKASNELVFTDDYNNPSDGVYILRGYYEYNGNEYKWHDSDLILDEHYYGSVEVVER